MIREIIAQLDVGFAYDEGGGWGAVIFEYTETLRENRESTSGFRTKLAYMMKSAPGPVVIVRDRYDRPQTGTDVVRFYQTDLCSWLQETGWKNSSHKVKSHWDRHDSVTDCERKAPPPYCPPPAPYWFDSFVSVKLLKWVKLGLDEFSNRSHAIRNQDLNWNRSEFVAAMFLWSCGHRSWGLENEKCFKGTPEPKVKLIRVLVVLYDCYHNLWKLSKEEITSGDHEHHMWSLVNYTLHSSSPDVISSLQFP